MKLPKQLQNKRFRFIKIIAGTKKAYEDDWNVTSNYKYNDPDFVDYMKTAKAYGVACRYGELAIIDCDKKEVESDVFMKLPNTFTVKTGSGGTHFYYIVIGLKDKIIMEDSEKIHHGEVQSKDAQCLGAGSLHPNGNHYEIIHNNDIAEITEKQLKEVIKPYCSKKERKFVSNNSSGLDLDIASIANTIHGLDKKGNKLIGSHPIHGSETKKNFEIDLDKNAYYCFRHEQGGDALCLAALLNKSVDCSDMIPGYFKKHPKVFKETLAFAKKEYKYAIEIKKKVVRLFVGDKNNKLDVQGIVEHIMENYKFVTIREATGKTPHIYIYQDGYYNLDGTMVIEGIIKKLFNNIPWKSFYRNEIMEYIKTENVVDREDVQPPKHLLNVENGIFNLQTDKLERHNSKYYFLYKIPVKYKPDAVMPKIASYFESTLKPEYVKFSQEIFGYSLYSDYPIAGIFYLFGKGGNGKGVWIHLLSNMLGNINVASEEVSSLMNTRFSSANLYGKLANICGELSPSVMRNTDMLKRLSAGDSISAEFKGRDAFNFYSKAKIITACNSIPPCEDDSDGWMQRQYVIPFLKKFRKTKDDDTHLKEKLVGNKKEMEGLLLWSIKGLKRILAKEQFSYKYDMEHRYNMYQLNSQYFLERQFVKGNFDDYVPVEDIRKAYSKWCKANDVPKDSEVSIARKLTNAGYILDRIQIENDWIWIRRYLRKV